MAPKKLMSKDPSFGLLDRAGKHGTSVVHQHVDPSCLPHDFVDETGNGVVVSTSRTRKAMPDVRIALHPPFAKCRKRRSRRLQASITGTDAAACTSDKSNPAWLCV
jgi:hypothetical protein